ncbi:hypothetical protein HDU96_005157, partial [Phlyctochytrium bullatum]
TCAPAAAPPHHPDPSSGGMLDSLSRELADQISLELSLVELVSVTQASRRLRHLFSITDDGHLTHARRHLRAIVHHATRKSPNHTHGGTAGPTDWDLITTVPFRCLPIPYSLALFEWKGFVPRALEAVCNAYCAAYRNWQRPCRDPKWLESVVVRAVDQRLLLPNHEAFAMEVAVLLDSAEIMRRLVALPAPSPLRERIRPALLRACKDGALKVLASLLDHPELDACALGAALHMAIAHGQRDATRLLLSRG